MKKERKEALLSCFPPVSSAQTEKMKGKGAANYIVFLTRGAELFARGYHRYSNGQLVERQRYVFAKDGAVRYGSENGKQWSVRTEFREPVFCLTSYGYTFDNSYKILGEEAIRQSDMRYSQYEKYTGNLLMCYLNKYCQHPNIEYLMKQGFDPMIEYCTGYWGGRYVLELSKTINWKSNNLLQMLGITKLELKVLRGNEHLYETYISWRNEFPKVSPGDLINFAKVFGDAHGTMATFVEQTGATPQRITRYIEENGISTRDYYDYLEQCKRLKYNTTDTAICFPHNCVAMHERLSAIIKYQHNEQVKEEFKKRIEERNQLEYSNGELMILQPKQLSDIAYEGKALSHCVGGYAERHAIGKLTIMFLRRKSAPNEPYYTIEVSNDYKIVQCRGYKNNWVENGGQKKPQEIINVEKKYQQYLDGIAAKKSKTKSRRKTA